MAVALTMDEPDVGVWTAPPLDLDYVRVDGMRVRVGHCPPVQGRAEATVVILTGRTEFIEKYEETIADLTARGFAVAIFEWRGQGGSDRFLPARHRGHVVQVEDYLADLDAVIEHLERRRLPQPFVMLAHSMGGHVGLRYLHGQPRRFIGAVMSAPMFGIRLRVMPEAMARAICDLAIRIGAGTLYAPGQRDLNLARCRYQRNKLTSCPVRYASYRARIESAPELALGGVTYGWLGAALRSIALTREPGFAEAIPTPVLVGQAGRERIVCNRSQARLVRRLPRGKLLVLPEARHEILLEREPVRERFLEAFGRFTGELLQAR